MPEARQLRRGMRGPDVARLQRRLSRAGFHTRADGMFGPATKAALRAFQQASGLDADGIAGPLVWSTLISAASAVNSTGGDAVDVLTAQQLPGERQGPTHPTEAGNGVAAETLRVALAELDAGAREVGGNNRGEWVRKYMGVEGLPWCAGFATWCYRRACERRNVDPLLTERWSSSRLVREARSLDLVVDPARPGTSYAVDAGFTGVRPGHFFVLRGGPTGYSHTGIVRSLGWTDGLLEYITTVEGNTRLRGESGSDRVVTRWRGVSALVFIAF